MISPVTILSRAWSIASITAVSNDSWVNENISSQKLSSSGNLQHPTHPSFNPPFLIPPWNVSSIAAFIGFPALAHYCASKGGVSSITRALALELSPKKINVNAVAPGAIDTPGASETSNEDVKKQTIAAIPLARMGTPEDIANIVVFLASEESNYITGQTVIVNGGWTLR